MWLLSRCDGSIAFSFSRSLQIQVVSWSPSVCQALCLCLSSSCLFTPLAVKLVLGSTLCKPAAFKSSRSCTLPQRWCLHLAGGSLSSPRITQWHSLHSKFCIGNPSCPNSDLFPKLRFSSALWGTVQILKQQTHSFQKPKILAHGPLGQHCSCRDAPRPSV